MQEAHGLQDLEGQLVAQVNGRTGTAQAGSSPNPTGGSYTLSGTATRVTDSSSRHPAAQRSSARNMNKPAGTPVRRLTWYRSPVLNQVSRKESPCQNSAQGNRSTGSRVAKVPPPKEQERDQRQQQDHGRSTQVQPEVILIEDRHDVCKPNVLDYQKAADLQVHRRHARLHERSGIRKLRKEARNTKNVDRKAV